MRQDRPASLHRPLRRSDQPVKGGGHLTMAVPLHGRTARRRLPPAAILLVWQEGGRGMLLEPLCGRQPRIPPSSTI